MSSRPCARLTRLRRVASAAIHGMEQQAAGEPATETLSLCGAFRLVLAIAAARDNDRPQAHEHLDQARKIADRIGEGRDDFGTEFGPTNVALHAVELGDAGQALDLARDINPNGYQQNGKPGTTSISPRRTPCDGRSAKPCAAWKKPNGSLPSRPARTGLRENHQ
jgi:hypothetical protein